MKKLKLLLTVILAMTFSGYLFGQFTGDGFKQTVVGTQHDLSANPDANVIGGTVVCEYCHSPHKVDDTPSKHGLSEPPLLWNVQLKTGPFAVYGGSSTFKATDVRDPSTAGTTKLAAYMTLLCLSCHDGTVTAASFYHTWNDDPSQAMGTIGSFTPQNVGDNPSEASTGLSNDHPVDFTYSVSLATADGGIQSPVEGAGVRIPYVGKSTPLPLFKDAAGDSSGRVECATCHNPHNHTNPKFLRMSNAGSALCLNCHGS